MIKVGEMAPSFVASTYKDGSISEQINLSDFIGRWLLLFFYPSDFTFV